MHIYASKTNYQIIKFDINYQIIEVICAIQPSLQSFQEKYHQSQ